MGSRALARDGNVGDMSLLVVETTCAGERREGPRSTLRGRAGQGREATARGKNRSILLPCRQVLAEVPKPHGFFSLCKIILLTKMMSHFPPNNEPWPLVFAGDANVGSALSSLGKNTFVFKQNLPSVWTSQCTALLFVKEVARVTVVRCVPAMGLSPVGGGEPWRVIHLRRPVALKPLGGSWRVATKEGCLTLMLGPIKDDEGT